MFINYKILALKFIFEECQLSNKLSHKSHKLSDYLMIP